MSEITMEEVELNDETGLTLDDFGQANYVNNPNVNETIIFRVLKITENSHTKGRTNNDTEFDIGLKYKDGRVRRYDVETDLGVYTIKNWEIFFKLLGKEGLLTKYAKDNNKRFTGAKISIKRLLDGGHANYKAEDLMKIIGKTLEETKVYQEKIKKAIRDGELFEVKLID